MQKIFITGGNGWMASYFKEEFLKYGSVTSTTVDIASKKIVGLLDFFKPDIVINCAGKTGKPNIDWCETHAYETIKSNVIGPIKLVKACEDRGIYLVHLSTGCIYYGENNHKGYTELDRPNYFDNVYSASKICAEYSLSYFKNTLLLRARMPFDGSNHPRNLIQKLIHYSDILDVQNSLTYIPDFIDAAIKLINNKQTGIFNIVNDGTISPYEIAKLYSEKVKNLKFNKLEENDLNKFAKAGRSNCILNTDKLKKHGINMPRVYSRINQSLDQMKQNERIPAIAD